MTTILFSTQDDIDLEVTFNYFPGNTAKLDGPWEDCFEEEYPEVEFSSICLSNSNINIFNLLSEELLTEIEDYIITNANQNRD